MIFNGIDTYQIDVTNQCPLNCDHCYGLKSKTSMEKETLNKVMQAIIDNINANNDDEPTITISGGEIGLYDPSLIIEAVSKIKQNVSPKRPQIAIQTSLIFNINDAHKQLFQIVDEVSTSYDYKIRFKDLSKEILFWKNLNIAKQLNKNIQIIIALTKDLIKDISPEALFSFILSTGANHVELERLCQPMTNLSTFTKIKPLNKDVNDYMFECYKLYKEVQKYYNLTIDTFDCMEKSVDGEHYYEHGRRCCQQSLTFSPNGNISTCFMEQHRPFANILLHKYNESMRDYVIKEEQKIDSRCNNCKYLKYCLGDCHRMSYDETGCPTPIKIYEYIDNQKNNCYNTTKDEK